MLAEAIVCLALNVYYEARSQSVVEQIAVAQIVDVYLQPYDILLLFLNNRKGH